MLQSQFGLFVKLLEDVGQIQVGNNSQLDCDIFCVTITFKRIKNILGLINVSQTSKEINKRSFLFQYDFLGSISNLEIVLNKNDCYTVNQKVILSFRSSLKSLRTYFKRIFYIPMYLYYMNNICIANYKFDLSGFLPEDINYFNKNDVGLWIKHGSFNFDILNNIAGSTNVQPMLEFVINLELITKNSKYIQCDLSEAINNNTEMHFEKISCMSEYTVAELQLQQMENPNHSKQSGENSVKKSVRTVAMNTDDYFGAEDAKGLYLYYLKQFKEWKQQQILHFLNGLSRANEIYMQDLQERWNCSEDVLMARFEAKMTKCEEMYSQMISQLENLQLQLNNAAVTNIKIGDNINRNIESTYKTEFIRLEKKVEFLEKSAEVKGLRLY